VVNITHGTGICLGGGPWHGRTWGLHYDVMFIQTH
jgi:hypothetical protein